MLLFFLLVRTARAVLDSLNPVPLDRDLSMYETGWHQNEQTNHVTT